MKTYRLLRFAYWLAKFMPSSVMYWLCSLAGGIVYFFVPHIRRAVRDNMSHVLPGSTEKQRRKMSRQVIRNVYKNYYDILRIPRMKPEDVLSSMASLDGLEHLEEAVRPGKGVIVFTAHMGNFIMVAQLAPILGYKAATIAEDIQPAQMYNFINKLRGTFGLKLVKMGSAQMRTVGRLLREGGVLALAADRDVSDTGLPVQFFDAPADLPEGPVKLAMRLGVPLVPCFTWRLPNNQSLGRVYPPVRLQKSGDYESDLAVNMRKVAEILEGAISQAPDQWVVLQRVWDKPAVDLSPQKSDDVAVAGKALLEESAGSGTREVSGTGEAAVPATEMAVNEERAS
jgi:KDO2-lipid IV(A) lauroyltransferase